MWLNEVESAFSSWHLNTFSLMSVLCADQLLLRDVSASGSDAAVMLAQRSFIADPSSKW